MPTDLGKIFTSRCNLHFCRLCLFKQCFMRCPCMWRKLFHWNLQHQVPIGKVVYLQAVLMNTTNIVSKTAVNWLGGFQHGLYTKCGRDTPNFVWEFRCMYFASLNIYIYIYTTYIYVYIYIYIYKYIYITFVLILLSIKPACNTRLISWIVVVVLHHALVMLPADSWVKFVLKIETLV